MNQFVGLLRCVKEQSFGGKEIDKKFRNWDKNSLLHILLHLLQKALFLPLVLTGYYLVCRG